MIMLLRVEKFYTHLRFKNLIIENQSSSRPCANQTKQVEQDHGQSGWRLEGRCFQEFSPENHLQSARGLGPSRVHWGLVRQIGTQIPREHHSRGATSTRKVTHIW